MIVTGDYGYATDDIERHENKWPMITSSTMIAASTTTTRTYVLAKLLSLPFSDSSFEVITVREVSVDGSHGPNNA
jgi:hypothetical protein